MLSTTSTYYMSNDLVKGGSALCQPDEMHAEVKGVFQKLTKWNKARSFLRYYLKQMHI